MSSPNQDTPGAVTIVIPAGLPSLLGPQLVGLFLNWGLLGVLGVQVYMYYLCFPKDHMYTKVLVYTLAIMELAQTCMISSDGWQWLITAWGRPEQLEEYHLEWFDVPILAGIMSSAVQIFFAWRIWKLGRSIILSGLIVALSLVQGSAAVASGIQLRLLPSFAEIARLNTGVSVWLGGSAAVDIIIAISMTYFLVRAKGNFQQTNYLLARLVRLTVETGMLTATVATVDLILFNTFKTNNFHLAPAIVLAKLYTNTLMVVFNNRIFMQRSRPLTSSGTVTGSTMEPADYYSARLRDGMSRTGHKNLEISRTVEVNSFGDTLKESDTVVEDVPLESLSPHGKTSPPGRLEKYPKQISMESYV